MRGRRFARDPHWITTKYPTKQADGSAVPAGTRAFYFPASKTLLFGDEAETASRRFESERADEDAYRAGCGV